MAKMRAVIHHNADAIEEVKAETVWTARGKGLPVSAAGPHRSGETNKYLDNTSFHSLRNDSFCWGCGHPSSS